MSLLRECMEDAMGVVVDTLGNSCVLTNSLTSEAVPVNVVIRHEVEIYENHMFVGTVTTGTFQRAGIDPKIGDQLEDQDEGRSYTLDGVRAVTASKIEFVLGDN